MLQGRHFEVQEAGNCVDRIYEALQTDAHGKMWLGRNVTSTLFEKASDYFQTPEAFCRMIKVSFSYANRVISTDTCAVCLHVTFLRQSLFCASRHDAVAGWFANSILRGH